MDPSSVNSALLLITNVFALGKRATNIQYEEALVAARESIVALKTLNVDLCTENAVLRQTLSRREEFKLDKGVYWKGDNTEQPYCPACFENGNIPLQPDKRDTRETKFSCPKCTAIFNPFNYHRRSSGGVHKTLKLHV